MSTLHIDASSGVQNWERFKTAKGPYVELSPLPGSLIANNLLDLVCMDFTIITPSRHNRKMR